MFAAVEKFSGPAKILLGLIALTFVGFGASSVSSSSSDYIVKIGDRPITVQEVQRALQNAQASGNQNATEQAILQALQERAYLLEGAKLLGIGVSKEKLKQQIVAMPAFQENGSFSQKKFNDYLKQIGLSEDQFVAEEQENILLQNLMNLGAEGSIISDSQAGELLKLTQSARMVRSVTFNPQQFLSQVNTGDEALTAFYNEKKADYLIPEAVKFQYAVLSLQDLAAKQTVSEQELKTAFEQSANKGKPRREVQHILIPKGNNEAEQTTNKAQAEQVLAEVKANPAQFGELAKKYSQDPASAANGGDLGWVQQESGLPKAFEDLVFAMPKAGEISEVLTTDYGYHIIKLNKIQEQGTFEQDRPVLEADLKMKKAQAAFTKAREELAAAAFDQPDNLKPAADKLGLKIVSIDEWVTRKEADAQVAENQLSADFVKALFSDDVLKKKRNSEPVTVSENTVAVVRVRDVRAAKQQSFDEAKEQVKFNYLRAQAEKLAQDKAKQALVDLQTGEKVNLQWSPQEQLTAAQAGQNLPPQAYQALLKARPSADKPAYFLAEGLPVPVIIAVDSILPPENMETQLPQAKQALVNTEANTIFEGLMSYLQARVPASQGNQKLGNADNS